MCPLRILEEEAVSDCGTAPRSPGGAAYMLPAELIPSISYPSQNVSGTPLTGRRILFEPDRAWGVRGADFTEGESK